AADTLLFLLLQQEEASESDHRHRGRPVRRSRAVPYGELQNAAVENARPLRHRLVVVTPGIALVSDVLLVVVGDVARDGIGRSAATDAEPRGRLLRGEHIGRILRLRASHGAGVVTEAGIDALGGRTGLVTGLRLHAVARACASRIAACEVLSDDIGP